MGRSTLDELMKRHLEIWVARYKLTKAESQVLLHASQGRSREWMCVTLPRNHVIAVVAALCALTSVAIAGSKGTGISVNIGFNGAGSYFFGTTGTVRASGNSVEYIGCSITQYVPPGSNSNQIYCTARNSAGTTASCTRTVGYNANLIASVTANTHFDVSFDQASGICTAIRVMDSSSYPITQL